MFKKDNFYLLVICLLIVSVFSVIISILSLIIFIVTPLTYTTSVLCSVVASIGIVYFLYVKIKRELKEINKTDITIDSIEDDIL
jgi:hypothetical protein